MQPRPIEYASHSPIAHADAPVRNSAGRASVFCFALPAGAAALGFVIAWAGVSRVGEGFVLFAMLLSMFLCPGGLVLGVIGLFAPDRRRFAAAIGATLNASVILLYLRPLLPW
jgi:hypothetical protein